MARAEVGDDVYGEDPVVNRLQETVAQMLGKEAALFTTSGTQGNLCGLLAHCGRGDEYIVGDHAHTYMYEGGGAAVLGSIQPQPVPTSADGMIDLAAAEAAVKPRDNHFARTRLLCLENTTDGKVLTLEQMWSSAASAQRFGLAHHLDGARLWNAAVALDVTPQEVAAPFDSVSVCLSKGLGTPMGSVLAGSSALIEEAHKWRKMLGGGLRQAGIVAAAGLHALEHHLDRLRDDHANAARLADGLGNIDGVTLESCHTNMVFIRLNGDHATGGARLDAKLAQRGIITRWNGPEAQPRSTDAVSGDAITRWKGPRARLVTHLDISAKDIETVIATFRSALCLA